MNSVELSSVAQSFKLEAVKTRVEFGIIEWLGDLWDHCWLGGNGPLAGQTGQIAYCYYG